MNHLRNWGGIVVFVLAGTLSAFAEISTLYSNAHWRVEAATDTGSNPTPISFSIDKEAPVVVTKLLVYNNPDSTNYSLVYSITGSGMFQPVVPPVGTPGAAYSIGSYWDCDQGFVGPLGVTTINISSKKNKAKNDELEMTGSMSNSNSMRGDKLNLKFFPIKTDAVRLDLTCQLVATRRFCVDKSREDVEDEFRIVTIGANYVSAEQHENDLLRYIKITERICGGFYGCIVKKESFCVSVTNQTGYLINAPRRLGSPRLLLAHTDSVTTNTPGLSVTFKSPNGGQVRPQGYMSSTDDVTTDNLQLWANLVNLKTQYGNKNKVLRVRLSFEATSPKTTSCDNFQE